MFRFALSSLRKAPLALAAAALIPFASLPSQAQPDPPAEAGRISAVMGNVSVQPAGVDSWGEAVPNLPVGPGDRVFTDTDSRVEIQVGQTFVRIGPNSDVTLVSSGPTGIQFGVAAGSAHIRVNALWPDQLVVVQTPNGSAAMHEGDLRIDAIHDGQATVFAAYGTNVKIAAAGGYVQYIGDGTALELAGTNPVEPQWLEPVDSGNLDAWSAERDQSIREATSYQYVSREVPGAFELDHAGTWTPGTEYGAIWFPNSVPGGWAPYHYGHWINRSPWGWVWVEDESWGYAPFHYGRWVSYHGRWGWIPGPPAEHPVWSPALVVFAGGQPGVSAWFPLGPGEPYKPWYPCSPQYVDRVNITNIMEAPRVHVERTYVNINFGAVVFANRSIGLVAVNNADFAAGRAANRVSVQVDVHIVDHIQVVQAPEVKPTAESFTGHAPARPVPVAAARPVLINENGKAEVAKPGAVAVEAPVKPVPKIAPPAGRKVMAPPPAGKFGGPAKGSTTEPAAGKPMPPAAATRPEATTAPAPVKPATTPTDKMASKPGASTTPAKPGVTPNDKTVAPKPADKTVPAATTAPKTNAKPGTTPPAKTDKNNKDDKKKPNPDDKDKPKPDTTPN